MTPYQRYERYLGFTRLPLFETAEEAEATLSVEDGENVRFLLTNGRGAYQVCAAYVTRARGQDPRVTSRVDLEFLHCELVGMRRAAVRYLGEAMVETLSREIDDE